MIHWGLVEPKPAEKARGIEFFARLFSVPRICELIAMYFDPPEGETRKFAGATFDLVGRTPENASPNEISASDLLAVSLLGVPFDARAVRALIEDRDIRGKVENQLLLLPQDIALQSADIALLTEAAKLGENFDAIDGVGATRATKLLARKRPHLIPIWDSIVGKYLQPKKDEHWLLMKTVVQDSGVRTAMAEARDAVPKPVREQLGYVLGDDEARLPADVRLLDVGLWLVGSTAKSAAVARERARLTDDQRDELFRSLPRPA